ncbi:MAG: CarD family transcriptional regulator [Thermodesulfobacteriota bacterium]
MFKVGDMAVYPAHGVGRIEGMESKIISGAIQHFFVMRILDNDMIIMIPTQNVDSVGLRQIINRNQVPEIIKILKQTEVTVETHNWNRRYRDYMQKIKTGSLFEVAAVLRDLSLLKRDKELSFGERKMLDMARSLLVKEISVARKQSEAKVEKEIMTIFVNSKGQT